MFLSNSVDLMKNLLMEFWSVCIHCECNAISIWQQLTWPRVKYLGWNSITIELSLSGRWKTNFDQKCTLKATLYTNETTKLHQSQLFWWSWILGFEKKSIQNLVLFMYFQSSYSKKSERNLKLAFFGLWTKKIWELKPVLQN